ncbi:hypothetical protein DEJ48_28270 [Streptomyces venezuelae]|uniref:Uncharacterized protein n=1 Tax=Streptomyces venezuelae TaxID=54571 RepID=A0A5P2CDD6_STRVZ|nr:hypothetical protein [Streptomyces venezuelae]QES39331.1 hypothetical protein DEJ48_28270 [Streptomyces venezuelae]
MTDDNRERVEAHTTPASTEAPAIGTLVVDEARKRLGVVMDDVGGRLQIRPPSGGREWDADPVHVRSAREDEILRVRVAATAAMVQGRSL